MKRMRAILCGVLAALMLAAAEQSKWFAGRSGRIRRWI